MLDYKELVDNYLHINDWRVKENSTVTYSVGGLILSNSGAITANYWLSEIYDQEIADAHKSGAIHPHDARMAHLPARLGNGNGLVQPLPAAEHATARSQYGFTRPGHMLDGIDVVNVHGTIVENLHLTRHLSFVC